MLENTVLNNEIITKLLKEKYNLEVLNVEQLNRGSANIFNLDNEYILKECPSDRNIEEIEKEYRVIKYLSDLGFRVPKYILTTEGKCYFKYNDRIIILQAFLRFLKVLQTSLYLLLPCQHLFHIPRS